MCLLANGLQIELGKLVALVSLLLGVVSTGLNLRKFHDNRLLSYCFSWSSLSSISQMPQIYMMPRARSCRP